MNKPTEFDFEAELWVFQGKAAWYFVTLPKETAHEIKFYFAEYHRGWGSLPVRVSIRNSEWETSIFKDKKADSYMLPIKKEIRESENLNLSDRINIKLEVLI